MKLQDAIEKTYKQRWAFNADGEKSHARATLCSEILNNPELKRIDVRMIDRLHSALFDRGIKQSTTNRYSASLRTVLNMAHKRWNAIDSVPYIQRYKESRGRIRFLSYKEEAELLHTVERQDIVQLFAFLLDTGLRYSEAISLQHRDIDLKRAEITIWENKGDRPRTIPLTDRAKHILKKAPIPKPFGHIAYHEAYTAWNKAKKEMGLQDDDDFVIHILRHTCASRLVQNEVDLYTVKEILGHSNITVTEKYAHLNPENLRKAIDTLND